ncbi:MAG: hypothetical protein MJ071_08755 [Oscillospiraceae bacterium]|nr:hypothetical protein [Oscillospiraceae bacterium]
MTVKVLSFCAVLSLLTMQLPSCDFTNGVDAMLTPPRLTMEQEQIYQALQNAAGSQIRLKYPKSGDRLSAFTVADLDNDGSTEAIVFYEAGRASENENPLRICMLDKKEGQWRAVTEYPAAGAEIERVDITKLGTNPRMNLIVQYSMVDGANHAAEVFHYEDGTLNASLSIPYSILSLQDLDQNGTTEIFAASAAQTSAPAEASVYELNEEGIYLQSLLNLPEIFTDISRVIYGTLPDEQGGASVPIFYLDGITGATSVQTLVLNYHDNLLHMVYSDSADRFPNTARPGGFQTMDIDQDAEVEIPVNSSFYGHTNAGEALPLIMTNWYVCRNNLLMRKYSSYYSTQNGYIFVMPKRWERCVTAVQEDDEIVFYEFDTRVSMDDGTAVLLNPLLRLSVTNDAATLEMMQDEGYTLLRQNGSNYYLGKTFSHGNSLAITDSELLTSLKFL